MVLPGPVWIYLVLYIQPIVGSVAGTPCLVDTGYQPRRESLSICAPGVAVIGAHCLEISFISGADSCSGSAYGRIGALLERCLRDLKHNQRLFHLHFAQLGFAEIVKSGRVRARGCSASKSSWYWQQFQERKAEMDHMGV